MPAPEVTLSFDNGPDPDATPLVLDILARAIANHLSQAVGRNVVVDNRSGAGGDISVAAGAGERPDGCTVVLGTSGTHGVNASRCRDPGFDPVPARSGTEVATWREVIREAGIEPG